MIHNERAQEMTPEQITKMREECTPNITVTVRQVVGGHIINGRIVWVAPDGTPQGVQQDEAVCANGTKAAVQIGQYYSEYKFDEKI